jgi:drug/metabolite transporter (DMT)-like permease
MGCFVKLATTSDETQVIPSIEIVFFRAVFQGIIVTISMFLFTTTITTTSGLEEEETLIKHPFGLTKEVIKIVIIRGMCGGCGFCLYFYTISKLPLGDAVTLLSLNPIFTLLIASIVLHEPMTKSHIFASLSSFVGSVFLARPSFLFGHHDDDVTTTTQPSALSSEFQWGYITGILGACSGAGVFILIRKAGKHGVHTLNLLFSWCIFGLLFSSLILLINGKFTWPRTTKTWIYIFISCCFGTVAHFLLNYGGRLAPAGIASIMRSSGIIWSYLIEVLIFHEIPQGWTIIGVCLILTSLGVVAVEKHQETRYQQQYRHQRLENIDDDDSDDENNEGDNKGNNGTLQLQTFHSSGGSITKSSSPSSSTSNISDSLVSLDTEKDMDEIERVNGRNI